MANLDMPIGVLKRPVEPGACSLCPDGGEGRASAFCPVLESPVCAQCCDRLWGGDPYRLLTATSRLDSHHDLGELLRACIQCELRDAKTSPRDLRH